MKGFHCFQPADEVKASGCWDSQAFPSAIGAALGL